MDNTLSKTSFHLILAQKMGNTFTKCKHKCISSYNSTLNLKFESLKVNSWCDHIYFSTVWTLCLVFSAGIVPQTSWTTSQRSSLDVSCLVLHSLTTRIMLRSMLWGDSPQRLVVCFSICAFTALPVCLRSLSYWKIKLFPVRLFGLFYIHTSISSVDKTPNTTDQNEAPNRNRASSVCYRQLCCTSLHFKFGFITP